METSGASRMAGIIIKVPHSKRNDGPSSATRRQWLSSAALIGLNIGLSASLPGLALAAKTSQATLAAPASKILIVGDSLSAEYGLARGAGWVSLLTQRLHDRPNTEVINASISGDTTSGGLSRLPSLLAQHRPTLVIIELGANDALRGLPLKGTLDNLVRMIRLCRQAGASKVLLVGMMVPPNYGTRYAQEFTGLFLKVARAEQTGLVPFFLKGVADRPDARDWFQGDGLHPLAKAHPVILENVWRELKPMLP